MCLHRQHFKINIKTHDGDDGCAHYSTTEFRDYQLAQLIERNEKILH